MISCKHAIRFCAGLFAALLLQGCNQGDSKAQSAYEDTVRCFQAASAYGQILSLLGKTDDQKNRMIDYGLELRERALAEGAKLKKTEADVMGATEPDFLNRFLVLDEENQKAALTDFGKKEIEHCKLDAVIAATDGLAPDGGEAEPPPSP